MDIEKYRHLVLFVCFALAAVAVWVFTNYPLYMPALLVLAAAMPLFVRQLKSRPVKMLSYLSLGFVSYLTVAESFIVPAGSEELLFSFLPFLLFAIANAIGVIIGYSDSHIFGGVYCVGSVLALLYGKGPVDFVSIDRFVIGIILFTCSSFTFVHLISRNEKPRDSVFPLVSGCVIAAILLTVMFSLRFFNMDMLYQGRFDEISRKVSPLFINMLWLSLVSNGFVILVGLIAHDLTMYAFELRREIRNGDVLYYKGVPKEEKSEEEGEEDSFSSIILRLRKFIQDLPEYDSSAASNVLTRFDAEFNSLSLQYGDGSKEKAKSLLAKAKRMVKELTESEEPRKPPKLSFKKSDMIELPRNTTLLVEGPIGSRKEECCLRFLKLELQRGKKAAICSYEPEAELQWFNEQERSRIGLFKVEPNITEMSLTITKAVESKPEIVYFNILYKLLPAYSSDVLAEFISSNLKKLKKAGITGIFVMEKEMISTQMLSTIESLFDGVVEFQIREEGDELAAYYRVKEFKLKEFETNWKEFK
ncbi:MAG: hypothetical protein Sv326_0220 [Candidatus Fermentimicrarchaeum limneticum]|uniref:KaiC-like domain-containing protein n=1 Tax=Fermentimicrarchaeum limneticum TaxID=2795018 RepID=A0A7D6BGC4_FERL1|nr:MAG: hypothetical protein Sv326_0220 [Candidatus Fermentimicrarchaeum limneticum]